MPVIHVVPLSTFEPHGLLGKARELAIRETPDGLEMDLVDPAVYDLITKTMPRNKPRMRGLGDVVAKVTSAVGIKPCGGCRGRQEKLNKLVPFKP